MELESPSSLPRSWQPDASMNALVLTRCNSKALRVFWNKDFYLRVKAACKLSRSSLIWRGRSVNSPSWNMRSMWSIFCRITLFSPHEYIASASNVSWRDIVSIEMPSCLSEILIEGFQNCLGCIAGALPFQFMSAWEVLLLTVVCKWVLGKGLCLEKWSWK